MQPVPKAAYRSDFRENTNFCPQRDASLGPLAPQASVLPLDHCDLMEDNQGAIAISRNPVEHARTKHIDIRYHFVREAIKDRVIELRYCSSQNMIADILTKPLPRGQFEKLRSDIGLDTLGLA